jgi:hypothetical protein
MLDSVCVIQFPLLGDFSFFKGHSVKKKRRGRNTSETAGFGTGRPVVWEDGSIPPVSYPILLLVFNLRPSSHSWRKMKNEDLKSWSGGRLKWK